jgi:uncharacterized protein YhbP (UPF0306 family)
MNRTTDATPQGLLQGQRTLVLATSDPGPWSAPVYFVFRQGRLYFLSSPRSRHVTAALAGGRCAGSVHRDGGDWRDIVGLQMEGTVVEVPEGSEAVDALAAYAGKFPAVKDLLGREAPDLRRFGDVLGARLYAFVPERAFHVDNRAGLVGRQEIPLPR